MTGLMHDSRLNEAEHALQHSLRNLCIFNGLLMLCTVAAAFMSIRALPDRRPVPPLTTNLVYRPVGLTAITGPLRLAGAWEVTANDRRFGGLSALALDRGRFIAVSDLGAVIRFDLPTVAAPVADIKDLRDGPGPWSKKWTRDAESIVRDPRGRGWWVGYEQRHSLWLYDAYFDHAIGMVGLGRNDWWDNRGAEALIAETRGLLVFAENGRDAMQIGSAAISRLPLTAGADVTEAARAPDGSIWLLLRSGSWSGISQRIAPLFRTAKGYEVGPGFSVPKAAFDNLEGMAIAPGPGGGWRFWLVSDNGRLGMVRTLLIALDYVPSVRHDKSPAAGAGPSL